MHRSEAVELEFALGSIQKWERLGQRSGLRFTTTVPPDHRKNKPIVESEAKEKRKASFASTHDPISDDVERTPIQVEKANKGFETPTQNSSETPTGIVNKNNRFVVRPCFQAMPTLL